VRKAGQRVRITGQLIDTTTGAHIWADRFDGSLEDVFELQDQVASSVVGAIEPKLRLAEIERSARKPTNSLDAYDLYLRALAESHKPALDGWDAAIGLLRRALGIDSSYAPAAGLIGHVRMRQRIMGVQLSDEDVADALRLARHAIEVGRDDPDALWMGGHTLALLAGEHAAAMNAIDRATTLNPNCANGWGYGGFVNCYANRPDAPLPQCNARCDSARSIRAAITPSGASPTASCSRAGTRKRWIGWTGRCTTDRAITPPFAARWRSAAISVVSMRA